MTLSRQILELGSMGRSTREIASIIYGIPVAQNSKAMNSAMAFVRVALRQRQGGRASETDRRYRQSDGCVKRRRARHRARMATDPNYRADKAAYAKKWFAENREYVTAYAKKWRAENREHYLAQRREYKRRWRLRHREGIDAAPEA